MNQSKLPSISGGSILRNNQISELSDAIGKSSPLDISLRFNLRLETAPSFLSKLPFDEVSLCITWLAMLVIRLFAAYELPKSFLT